MKMFLWRIIYFGYPCVLRILEWARVHNYRQEFLIGHLSPSTEMDELQAVLHKHGFEPAILAWRDPGEVFSLRMVDGVQQYHLRLFDDGELRGHLEYTPETHPFRHIFESGLSRSEKFESLLVPFLMDKTAILS